MRPDSVGDGSLIRLPGSHGMLDRRACDATGAQVRQMKRSCTPPSRGIAVAAGKPAGA